MHYQDFILDIQATGEDAFAAVVLDADGHEQACSPFPRPLSQKDLDLLLTSRGPAPPASQPRDVGTLLFHHLFQGEIERLYRDRRAALRRGEEGLRIRLRLGTEGPEAAYLNSLPWEWLWDPREQGFLAIDLSTPVVRDGAAGVKPTRLAIVFDKSEGSHRNELYADYKGHRPPMPDILTHLTTTNANLRGASFFAT